MEHLTYKGFHDVYFSRYFKFFHRVTQALCFMSWVHLEVGGHGIFLTAKVLLYEYILKRMVFLKARTTI